MPSPPTSCPCQERPRAGQERARTRQRRARRRLSAGCPWKRSWPIWRQFCQAVSGVRILATDPELHLRLLGEQIVTDRNPGEVNLVPTASAFVAVGVLPLDRVQSVLRDYALAARLRTFEIPGAAEAPRRTSLTSPPPTPRVAWGTIEDDHSHGFRYAVISDRHAEVTFAYNGSSNWSDVAKHFPKPQGF